MTRFALAALLAAALALSGCTKMKDLVGMGNDNTVIPGQREDAIPGQTQFPGPGETIQPGTSSAEPILYQTICDTTGARWFGMTTTCMPLASIAVSGL